MTNSIPPDSLGPSTPVSPSTAGGPVPSFPQDEAGSGGGFAKFKTWLGEKNYRMFLSNICQQISDQIAHAQKREKRVSERLKRAETGRE